MKLLVFLTLIFFSTYSFAQNCKLSTNNTQQKLSCEKTNLLATEINSQSTQYSLDISGDIQLHLEMMTNSRQLQLFSFSSAKNLKSLTLENKKRILELLTEVTSNNDYSSFLLPVKFFSTLPIDEDLTSLAMASRTMTSRESAHRAYQMICEHVGREKEGFYNMDDDESRFFSEIVRVGDASSKCYGRCGFGCNDDKPVYTQECLDHDVCHRTTGKNFGPCADEFWQAAHGYLAAPNCRF